MEISFDKTYLETLYTIGKTDDKKHRFQPDIIRRYQKTVNFLKMSSSIETLWQIRSLNYEILTGDKDGISIIDTYPNSHTTF